PRRPLPSGRSRCRRGPRRQHQRCLDRGECRIAPEGRAPRPVEAAVAQRTGPRTEVVALACPLDRLPHRVDALWQEAALLLGGRRDDGQWFAEVEQLNACRAAPEILLAQERVELHTIEPALLVL